MPRPPIDLHRKVRDILAHVDALPAEAGAPLAHYNRSSTDLWNLLLYVERAFSQVSLQPAAVRRHMGRLHGMVLVNLVETFERYLKEAAAGCVDHLARYVLDDRLEKPETPKRLANNRSSRFVHVDSSWYHAKSWQEWDDRRRTRHS